MLIEVYSEILLDRSKCFISSDVLKIQDEYENIGIEEFYCWFIITIQFSNFTIPFLDQFLIT